MKKFLAILIIFMLLFSVNVYAQEEEQLNTDADNLDLSQERSFSEEAREELLGIASQFESQTNIENIEIDNNSFNLTGNGRDENPGLQLLSDLNFNTDYSQSILDDELNSETQFELEYAINSRTLIRAGYTLASREWWEMQSIGDPVNSANSEDIIQSGSNLNINSSERIYREESESSRSIGLAYQPLERFTLSADYIDNNPVNNFNNNSNANTAVFGLQYNDPMGSIRASYQLDLGEDLIQRITGVELDFQNLATFSAAYKLLDIEDLNSTLSSSTAWDLGLGVNLNDNYGLNLGYELIETDDDSENETNIRASFEINF